MALALEGKIDELLRRDDIWYCTNCHECKEHCPQGFGTVDLIFRLRNLAIEQGIFPEVVGHRDSEFAGSGYGFAPNNEIRSKLGLPEITGAEIKDIKKMIRGSNIQKVLEND